MFRVSHRRLKQVVAFSAIVAALSVTGVSSAAAAPAAFNIPANSGIGVAASGTLAITDGVESTNCVFSSSLFSASNSASLEGSFSANTAYTTANCGTGKPLTMTFVAPATKEGGTFKLTNVVTGSGINGKNPLLSGGPSYLTSAFSVPFTNGSGSTPSKLTFNGTLLGTKAYGGTLSATGSLTIRKGDGSLLLLS